MYQNVRSLLINQLIMEDQGQAWGWGIRNDEKISHQHLEQKRTNSVESMIHKKQYPICIILSP